MIDSTKNIILNKIPGTHNREKRKSDHRYIKTTIALNKLERGSGYWKLNVSHLEKQDYIKGINNIFNTLETLWTPFQSGKFSRLERVIFQYILQNIKKIT